MTDFTWFDQLLKESEEPDVNTNELVAPDDVISVCFSSGTTGTPKGILLTHRALVNNVCMSWLVKQSSSLSFLI